MVFQASEYEFASSGGTIGLNATNLDGKILTIQNINAVPEPSSFVMGLTGRMAMFWRLRKRGLPSGAKHIGLSPRVKQTVSRRAIAPVLDGS
ncbi:MAG: hypothetical protein WCK15_25315 [Pirellula sp.]